MNEETMAELLSVQVPLCKETSRINTEDQFDASILGRSTNSHLSSNLYNARISNDLRKKVNNGSATGIIMSNLPKRPPIDIEFDEISFCVPDKRIKGGNKIILNSVSGCFRSGRLTALMGPSGAGKSTLMNIAAGYKCSNVVGNVLVNGKNRDLRRFRKMSCYIMQEDHLLPHLTVAEAMNISANLKLGSRSTPSEKEAVISEILETLNLQESTETRSNNLSGGQRKRLSIALELVNNPPVMFFDEPTSGLDSSSSFQVISLLKTLALGGRTIICTIHQPSAKLFEKFDYLFALAEGQCIYHGAVRGLVPFMGVMSLECPSYHNPADFLMEVASGDYGDYIHKLNTGVRNGKCQNYGSASSPPPCRAKAISNGNEDIPSRNPVMSDSLVKNEAPVRPPLLDSCSNESMVHLEYPGTSDLQRTDHSSIDDIPDSFPASSWTQFVILFKRSFLSCIRDGILTKLRIYSHICTGLLIGTLYYSIGNDASKVFNNSGSLFFCMMFLMFTAMMPTILTFPLELKVFMREHLNYWYSMKSYYLAMTFADFPFQLTYPILYVAIAYFMTDQPFEMDRFCMVTTMCIMTSLVAQSIGLAIGAGMDVTAAVFLGPISSIPILLFSGFFVTFSTMPIYLRWISYISYIRYGFEGILISVYGYDRGKLHCSQPYCHFKSPQKFLTELDMQDASFWFNFGMLWVFFVIIRVFGYFVLKWRLMNQK